MSDPSVAPAGLTAAGTRVRGLTGGTGFAVMAVGQAMSMFGSQLTSFAMGVWVYQRTGSATALGLIAFCTLLPEILLSPVAGVLVDRWNRRTAMLVGDTGSGLVTAAMAALAIQGVLEPYWVYPFVIVAAAFRSLQAPALGAVTPLLVPAEHLARANGALEVAGAIAMTAGPVVAGGIFGRYGLGAILALDMLSFAVAVCTLLFVYVPSITRRAAAPGAPAPSLLREALEGWHYVQRHRGLLALLGLFAVLNYTNGTVEVLLPPLVLGFASAQTLGAVMSAAGVGGLLGGVVLAVSGGPRRAVSTILMVAGGQGAILLLAGFKPSVPLIVGAGFFYSMTVPVLAASSNTLWQTRVSPEIMGRAFAVRRVVAWSALPLAYVLAGRLADRVYEPLMRPDGALAATLGPVIGVGQGRGIALLFITLGFVIMGAAVLFSRHGALRALDATPAAAPATAEAAVAQAAPAVGEASS